MTGRRERAVAAARAVRRTAADADVSLLAAAIAYYAFVSTVPLAVLGLAVATTVGGEALADRLVALAGDLLAPAGEAELRTVLARRQGIGGVTAVGLAVLVWGSLKAFRALDRAFSRVYGTAPATSTLDSFADAVVALSAVGAGVLAMLVIGAGVALVPDAAAGAVGAVVLALTLLVAFLPLYYLFPDAEHSPRAVLPGAALAAVGWTALGAGFGLYATYAGGASVYGLLGAVLLALTWFYLGALLLLLGAAVNAVRTGHAPRADR